MMDTMALTLLQKWVAIDKFWLDAVMDGKDSQADYALQSKKRIEHQMREYIKAIHEVDKETQESPV